MLEDCPPSVPMTWLFPRDGDRVRAEVRERLRGDVEPPVFEGEPCGSPNCTPCDRAIRAQGR